ncbi:MAG: hypothetical protein DHS20C10_06890 [marine bacterium B5-7]|nr:MAG: hypothetical protein DHS20C10_06890 [marine bacterium B5-7]
MPFEKKTQKSILGQAALPLSQAVSPELFHAICAPFDTEVMRPNPLVQSEEEDDKPGLVEVLMRWRGVLPAEPRIRYHRTHVLNFLEAYFKQIPNVAPALQQALSTARHWSTISDVYSRRVETHHHACRIFLEKRAALDQQCSELVAAFDENTLTLRKEKRNAEDLSANVLTLKLWFYNQSFKARKETFSSKQQEKERYSAQKKKFSLEKKALKDSKASVEKLEKALKKAEAALPTLFKKRKKLVAEQERRLDHLNAAISTLVKQCYDKVHDLATGEVLLLPAGTMTMSEKFELQSHPAWLQFKKVDDEQLEVTLSSRPLGPEEGKQACTKVFLIADNSEEVPAVIANAMQALWLPYPGNSKEAGSMEAPNNEIGKPEQSEELVGFKQIQKAYENEKAIPDPPLLAPQQLSLKTSSLLRAMAGKNEQFIGAPHKIHENETLFQSFWHFFTDTYGRQATHIKRTKIRLQLHTLQSFMAQHHGTLSDDMSLRERVRSVIRVLQQRVLDAHEKEHIAQAEIEDLRQALAACEEQVNAAQATTAIRSDDESVLKTWSPLATDLMFRLPSDTPDNAEKISINTGAFPLEETALSSEPVLQKNDMPQAAVFSDTDSIIDRLAAMQTLFVTHQAADRGYLLFDELVRQIRQLPYPDTTKLKEQLERPVNLFCENPNNVKARYGKSVSVKYLSRDDIPGGRYHDEKDFLRNFEVPDLTPTAIEGEDPWHCLNTAARQQVMQQCLDLIKQLNTFIEKSPQLKEIITKDNAEVMFIMQKLLVLLRYQVLIDAYFNQAWFGGDNQSPHEVGYQHSRVSVTQVGINGGSFKAQLFGIGVFSHSHLSEGVFKKIADSMRSLCTSYCDSAQDDSYPAKVGEWYPFWGLPLALDFDVLSGFSGQLEGLEHFYQRSLIKLHLLEKAQVNEVRFVSAYARRPAPIQAEDMSAAQYQKVLHRYSGQHALVSPPSDWAMCSDEIGPEARTLFRRAMGLASRLDTFVIFQVPSAGLLEVAQKLFMKAYVLAFLLKEGKGLWWVRAENIDTKKHPSGPWRDDALRPSTRSTDRWHVLTRRIIKIAPERGCRYLGRDLGRASQQQITVLRHFPGMKPPFPTLGKSVEQAQAIMNLDTRFSLWGFVGMLREEPWFLLAETQQRFYEYILLNVKSWGAAYAQAKSQKDIPPEGLRVQIALADAMHVAFERYMEGEESSVEISLRIAQWSFLLKQQMLRSRYYPTGKKIAALLEEKKIIEDQLKANRALQLDPSAEIGDDDLLGHIKQLRKENACSGEEVRLGLRDLQLGHEIINLQHIYHWTLYDDRLYADPAVQKGFEQLPLFKDKIISLAWKSVLERHSRGGNIHQLLVHQTPLLCHAMTLIVNQEALSEQDIYALMVFHTCLSLRDNPAAWRDQYSPMLYIDTRRRLGQWLPQIETYLLKNTELRQRILNTVLASKAPSEISNKPWRGTYPRYHRGNVVIHLTEGWMHCKKTLLAGVRLPDGAASAYAAHLPSEDVLRRANYRIVSLGEKRGKISFEHDGTVYLIDGQLKGDGVFTRDDKGDKHQLFMRSVSEEKAWERAIPGETKWLQTYAVSQDLQRIRYFSLRNDKKQKCFGVKLNLAGEMVHCDDYRHARDGALQLNLTKHPFQKALLAFESPAFTWCWMKSGEKQPAAIEFPRYGLYFTRDPHTNLYQCESGKHQGYALNMEIPQSIPNHLPCGLVLTHPKQDPCLLLPDLKTLVLDPKEYGFWYQLARTLKAAFIAIGSFIVRRMHDLPAKLKEKKVQWMHVSAMKKKEPPVAGDTAWHVKDVLILPFTVVPRMLKAVFLGAWYRVRRLFKYNRADADAVRDAVPFVATDTREYTALRLSTPSLGRPIALSEAQSISAYLDLIELTIKQYMAGDKSVLSHLQTYWAGLVSAPVLALKTEEAQSALSEKLKQFPVSPVMQDPKAQLSTQDKTVLSIFLKTCVALYPMIQGMPLKWEVVRVIHQYFPTYRRLGKHIAAVAKLSPEAYELAEGLLNDRHYSNKVSPRLSQTKTQAKPTSQHTPSAVLLAESALSEIFHAELTDPVSIAMPEIAGTEDACVKSRIQVLTQGLEAENTSPQDGKRYGIQPEQGGALHEKLKKENASASVLQAKHLDKMSQMLQADASNVSQLLAAEANVFHTTTLPALLSRLLQGGMPAVHKALPAACDQTAFTRTLHAYLLASIKANWANACLQAHDNLLTEQQDNSAQATHALHDMITRQRMYDPADPDNFHYVLLEYFSGFILRPAQMAIVEAHLKAGHVSDTPGLMTQAPTGSGKTTVLMVLLGLLKAQQGETKHLVTLVFMHALKKEALQHLRKMLGEAFQRMVFDFEFSAKEAKENPQYYQDCYQAMKRVQESGGVMVTTRGARPMLQEKFIAMLQRYTDGVQNTHEEKEALQSLAKILTLLETEEVAIYDEGDRLLTAMNEVHLQLGTPRPVSQQFRQIVLTVFFALLDHDERLGLRDNTVSTLPKEQQDEILQCAAEKVADTLVGEIKKSLDVEVNKTTLTAYFQGKLGKDEAVSFLAELNKQVEMPGLRDQMAMAKDLLTLVLPRIVFQKKNHRDYIRSKEHGGAVPTDAPTMAREHAEFDDILERMSYTTIDMMQEGISRETLLDWIEEMKNAASIERRMNNTLLEETVAAQECLRILGDPLSACDGLILGDRTWEEKSEVWLVRINQDPGRLAYFIDRQLSKVMFSPGRISADAQNIVSMSRENHSLSATDAGGKGQVQFARNDDTTASNVQGKAFRQLLSRFDGVTKPLINLADVTPAALFNTIHEQTSDYPKIIIDGGAFFVDSAYSPEVVAKSLYETQPNLGPVGYYGLDKLVHVYPAAAEKPQRFTRFYYHAAFARGADVKLVQCEAAYLLSSGNETLEDLEQHTGRCRNPNQKMRVVVPAKTGITSFEKWLDRSIVLDALMGAEQYQRSIKQQFRNVMRREMCKKLVAAVLSISSSQEKLAAVLNAFNQADFLMTMHADENAFETEGAYFDQHGLPHQFDAKPMDVLTAEYNKRVAQVDTISGLDEAEKTKLKEALKQVFHNIDPSQLPQKILAGSADLGKTVEVELEETVQRETQQLQELERQTADGGEFREIPWVQPLSSREFSLGSSIQGRKMSYAVLRDALLDLERTSPSKRQHWRAILEENNNRYDHPFALHALSNVMAYYGFSVDPAMQFTENFYPAEQTRGRYHQTLPLLRDTFYDAQDNHTLGEHEKTITAWRKAAFFSDSVSLRHIFDKAQNSVETLVIYQNPGDPHDIDVLAIDRLEQLWFAKHIEGPVLLYDICSAKVTLVKDGMSPENHAIYRTLSTGKVDKDGDAVALQERIWRCVALWRFFDGKSEEQHYTQPERAQLKAWLKEQLTSDDAAQQMQKFLKRLFAYRSESVLGRFSNCWLAQCIQETIDSHRRSATFTP